MREDCITEKSTSQFMKPWNLPEPHEYWERFMYSSVKGTNERQRVSLKGCFMRDLNEASWNETTLMYSVILCDGFGQRGQSWVIHLLRNPAPLQELSIIIDQTKVTPAVQHLPDPACVRRRCSQSKTHYYSEVFQNAVANITLHSLSFVNCFHFNLLEIPLPSCEKSVVQKKTSYMLWLCPGYNILTGIRLS